MKSILAVALAVIACGSVHATLTADQCDAHAKQADSEAGIVSKRALSLERLAEQCAGKSTYDILLGALYLDAQDLASAERAARRGLERGSSYRPNLQQVLAEVTLRRGQPERAYEMALRVTRDFPSYIPIKGFLVEIDFKAKRWQQAYDHLENGYRIQPSAPILLGMAGALHQLDRHEECIQAVYKALAMEPDRIAKTTGVLEAIFSLGVLKRNVEAAELVKRHMAANPNWASNPSMVNAARALGLSS